MLTLKDSIPHSRSEVKSKKAKSKNNK